MTRVTLSSRQYNMLKICLDKKVFSQEDAANYLQPSFTSMARRSYIATQLNGKTGEVEFYLTNQGKAAMQLFESSGVLRSNPGAPLSEFLARYVKRSIRKVAG